MSSRATGTSSFMQKYCCFSREPQALCRRLKEMARLASVAEKSLTGMETSPKDTVNEAIDRAAIGGRIVIQGEISSLGPVERLLQALFASQGLAPALAGLRQALRRIG